jgi:hypothetical protein
MIVAGLSRSFLTDILMGVHQPTDVYRIALYTRAADLTRETPAYTAQGEVIAPGYSAGGLVLLGYNVLRDADAAVLDFADPVWPNATITARAALIYNFSKDNRAVVVLDLGKDVTSTNGSFTVTLPEPTATTAVVRIIA